MQATDRGIGFSTPQDDMAIPLDRLVPPKGATDP